jgi:hypothetical protein
MNTGNTFEKYMYYVAAFINYCTICLDLLILYN